MTVCSCRRRGETQRTQGARSATRAALMAATAAIGRAEGTDANAFSSVAAPPVEHSRWRARDMNICAHAYNSVCRRATRACWHFAQTLECLGTLASTLAAPASPSSPRASSTLASLWTQPSTQRLPSPQLRLRRLKSPSKQGSPSLSSGWSCVCCLLFASNDMQGKCCTLPLLIACSTTPPQVCTKLQEGPIRHQALLQDWRRLLVW